MYLIKLRRSVVKNHFNRLHPQPPLPRGEGVLQRSAFCIRLFAFVAEYCSLRGSVRRNRSPMGVLPLVSQKMIAGNIWGL
jgi:hypothetical protein